MNLNGLFLSREKKHELETELSKLETNGRKEIAEKLDRARELSFSENDEELILAVEEKQKLERKISEIRDLLFRAKITKDECRITADVGCEVVVTNKKKIVIFKLVSPFEVDPSKHKISVDSKVGSALKGRKVKDKVMLTDYQGEELEYTILYIC